VSRLDGACTRLNKERVKHEVIVAINQANLAVKPADMLFKGSRAVGARKTTPENYDAHAS
jgi:hypothetical protein